MDTPNLTEERFLQFMSERFQTGITMDTPIRGRNANLDSLHLIEAVMDVEEEFGVKIPDPQYQNI